MGEGFKIECRVLVLRHGKLYPVCAGLAHIVTHKYSDLFTAVFGSLLLACTTCELDVIQNEQKVHLHLEDGRLVEVALMGGQLSRMQAINGQVVSEESNLLYFVATSLLRGTSEACDQMDLLNKYHR